MQILKAFQYQKIMESKIQVSLILTNIKNMLLTVYGWLRNVLMIILSKNFRSYLGE